MICMTESVRISLGYFVLVCVCAGLLWFRCEQKKITLWRIVCPRDAVFGSYVYVQR